MSSRTSLVLRILGAVMALCGIVLAAVDYGHSPAFVAGIVLGLAGIAIAVVATSARPR